MEVFELCPEVVPVSNLVAMLCLPKVLIGCETYCIMVSTFCSEVSLQLSARSSYSCRNSDRSSSSLPEKCGALDDCADGMAASPLVAALDMVYKGRGRHDLGILL